MKGKWIKIICLHWRLHLLKWMCKCVLLSIITVSPEYKSSMFTPCVSLATCTLSSSHCYHIWVGVADQDWHLIWSYITSNFFFSPLFFLLYLCMLLWGAHQVKLYSCQLHIMQAIRGDLGRMQEEWVGHTVAESLSIPFMVEQRFCIAAHIKPAGKSNKKTRLLWCLLSFLQETDRWLY